MADEQRMLHRDDLPMEVAEELGAKLKEEHGDDIQVRFAGDHDDALSKEAHDKMAEYTERCFVGGLCHSCETKFPGEWPPTDDSGMQGWSYYSAIGNDDAPGMLVCPKCEKDQSDGVPRRMDVS